MAKRNKEKLRSARFAKVAFNDGQSTYAAKQETQSEPQNEALIKPINHNDRTEYEQHRQKLLGQCGNFSIPKHLKRNPASAAACQTKQKKHITQAHKTASQPPTISKQGEKPYYQSGVYANPPPFLKTSGEPYKDMPDFSGSHVSLSLVEKGNGYMLRAHLYKNGKNNTDENKWETHEACTLAPRYARSFANRIIKWEKSITRKQGLNPRI